MDADFTQFGVIWWHEGTNTVIPPAFLDAAVIAKVNDYISTGGGLLLTGVAFHYIYDLGIESTEPRIYGAGSNEHNMELLPGDGMEDHPIFNGFEMPIFWHVIDYCASSDFYGTGGPTDGDVVMESVTYPDDHPVCEYIEGKGKVIIMGWIIPTWADKSANDNMENVEKLTANAINYLAENSAYSSVDSRAKLPLIWGKLKIE